MHSLLRIASAACLAALTLVAAGCGKKFESPLGLANQPPTIRLISTPPNAAGAQAVSYRLSWSATDPDGRVDHYLVATNPRSMDRVDASWQRVRETERVLTVRRPFLGAARSTLREDREPTVFAVRAVDDRDAVSLPAYRAMFGDNVAPSVQITLPRPSHLVIAYVPPNLRITWEGNDPDGTDPHHLMKYKFKLLKAGDSEFPFEVALIDPDSLRRFYAPAFAGWDSVPGDSLGHRFTGLEINASYLFVIVGFDEAGDYSPVFSLDTNMLRMDVAYLGTLGPLIRMYNEYFDYSYRTGGFTTDPGAEVPVEAPAGSPFTVHWFATPPPSAAGVWYRWALDIADVLDETPRIGENSDFSHWSAWGPGTSATIPAFFGPAAAQAHRIYIEAEDSNGLLSLGIVRLTQVTPSLDKDLLIVNDTRLLADHRASLSPDSVAVPTGLWPTAAELDTFLFAAGGVRWRSYPPGTMSRPGIFNGYPYDTLGTRIGAADLSVALSTLTRYRHVVWITDAKGALNDRPGTDPTNPMTALRYMTRPGAENTLAAYVMSGGQLWLVGGGAGYGATESRDRTSNGIGTFSSALGELAPGAMMYDLVHWRSEFKAASARPALARVPTTLGGAVYGLLPAALQARSAATDPLPPLRTGTTFYNSQIAFEYLSAPNSITDDQFWPRRGLLPMSVMDTLYRANDPSLPADPAINACMTVYRGHENGRLIFSGFDLWSWQRGQCIQVVDAVLQGIWGLSRNPTPRATVTSQPATPDRSSGQ